MQRTSRTDDHSPTMRLRWRGLVPAVLRWAVVATGLLIATLAYILGLLAPLLALTLVAGAGWGLVGRVVSAVRGKLSLAAWRRPFSPTLRPTRLQAINRALFWVAAGATQIWTMPADLIEPEDYRGLTFFIAMLTVCDVVMAFVPSGRPVRVTWNILPLLGWVFLGSEALRIVAGPLGPVVVLAAPFDGEWAVGQGGRSALVNHHYPVRPQSHALDLVKLNGGRAWVGDPTRLDSYAAFGAVLRAPLAGRVVRAVDRYPDMAIGKTDAKSLVGNHVVIEIGLGRYVLLAHLRAGSVAVSEGQNVQAGDPVGQCGNSGNTSQPHLHLQVQSGPDFRALNLRTFPIVFRGARLSRGRALAIGSPRRNDRVIATPADRRAIPAGTRPTQRDRGSAN